MRFTEIGIMIPEPNLLDQRLMAFVNVVLDHALVIRDMKIIRKPTGQLFVAMPSRKLELVCTRCYRKSLPCSFFCGGCGVRFSDEVRVPPGSRGRDGHSDVVFPKDERARELVEAPILGFYRVLVKRPDVAYGAWNRTSL